MAKLIHYKAMIILIIIMATTSFCKAQDLIIASPSQQAVIYVSAGYNSVSMYAAFELRRCIQLMTGKTLAINTTQGTGPQIVIGTLANTLVSQNAAALQLSGSNVNDEQIAVSRIGNNLFLAGKTARAALYATYTFLQDYLGIRWFWPGASGEFIPTRSTVSIDALGIFQAPQLAVRTLAITNTAHGSYEETDTWMARNKMNVASFDRDDTATQVMEDRKQKGFLARIGGHNIVLPKDTLTAHPSWASLRDGNRLLVDEAQLCWGNTELQTAIANMIAGWWNNNALIDIAHIYPADNQLFCQDALCQTLGNDVSTRWQNFCKKVIAKVNLTHPGKRYWTYAYQGYKPPPDSNAAPFEFVGYALYDPCYRHDFMSTSDATNSLSNTEITGWLTKNVQLGIRGYEYIMFTDPMFVPLVKWEVDQMNWMKDNGLVGYMSELRPFGRPPSAAPENTNWNTNRLNLYAAAKAMWGSITADSIVSDWNNTIYGTSGTAMRDYYKTFDTSWRNATQHIKMYNNAPVNHVDNFLSFAKLMKLNNHLRIARTTLENDVTDTALFNRRTAQIDLESKMLLNWQQNYNYKTERAHRYKTSVVKVTGTINWDDPGIPQLPVFENTTPAAVSEQTDVKMTWNSTHLVLRIVCHDNDVANRVQAATAHDDGDVLTDDRVEIYLQKNVDSAAYVRFAVNAKTGTPWRYDASSKGGTNFLTSWAPSPAWSATNSVSTANNTWTTTITIPFSAIGVSPTANTAFKMMIKRGRPEGNSGWPDASYYNQNSFAVVKLVDTIENPVFSKVILYDQGSANRFPVSVEFQKRNWEVASGISGETALEQKLNEDAAVLLIKYGSGFNLSNTFFQNQVTDFVSQGRVVIIAGSKAPVNNWFTGLPAVYGSDSVTSTRRTVTKQAGLWVSSPNNLNDLVDDGITPIPAYVPAAGWRKLATRAMTNGTNQPYLLTYQIGDGLLVLTTSSMGYSGGFEMFGSSNPINTVKLVENLRKMQDSIHSYSLSQVVTTVNGIAPADEALAAQQETFKVIAAANASLQALVTTTTSGKASISITDISGRTLAARDCWLTQGTNRITLPASMAKGNIYIVTLTRQGKRESIKFQQQ